MRTLTECMLLEQSRRNVSVVTDHIAKISKQGIELKSGSSINTDVIVFATGLNLSFLGKIQVGVYLC